MYPPGHHDADAPIRATDSDASLARLSAVQKGYLSDAFARHFVARAHLQPPRPPLINIGTYVRSESIDRLVESWIDLCDSDNKKCQIVSLGAGSDTRFWRLANDKRKDNVIKYIEIDFPEITMKKAMTIRKNKDLSSVLGEPEQVIVGNGGTSLHSTVYELLPADLRSPPSSTLSSLFSKPHDGTELVLDREIPTLLLFECVLAYMQPSASSAVIAWFTDYFRGFGPLGSIVYEMFGLDDAFGRVMKANLKTRNVELPGAEPYTSLSSLQHRFSEHGFTLSKALTLKEIRNVYIPKDELFRITRLEMLDEIEELNLVLDHYAITWGADLPTSSAGSWLTWGLSKADHK
ncbi:leucine carboxyl methyltransferase [Phellopilus nigrolimitatus]|nr:leucine carboxyl methyltransferase [Phellopilus nigrolimitatus]